MGEQTKAEAARWLSTMSDGDCWGNATAHELDFLRRRDVIVMALVRGYWLKSAAASAARTMEGAVDMSEWVRDIV